MQNNFYTARGYQLQHAHRRDLSPSEEDYLEMICRQLQAGGCRVTSLSQALHVRPSSVSKMLDKLSARGLLAYEKYGSISLTEEGWRYGRYLLWRHDIITHFFRGLLQDEEKAFAEAEGCEHLLSKESVEGLERLLPCLPGNDLTTGA